MKTALVTGGCGFIGSHLARKLVENGWKVDIVDDMSNGHLELVGDLEMRVVPGAQFLEQFEKVEDEKRENSTTLVIQEDFAHPSVLERVRRGLYDVVFHQAAVPRVLYSVENPGLTTETNVLGTVLLYEACRENVDRVVSASSSSVYGGASTLPTPEEEEKNPKSPYAWQKSASEDIAKLFGDLYGLEIVSLRYFNVFGPGQYGDSPYSTAVSAWCHALKNSMPMRSDGDGTQTRDMCFVENVVHANILAAESSLDLSGKVYNVACGDRTSNKEILEYLIEKFPFAVIQHADWRKGDVMHTQADISKIEEELGYTPLVRFWEGLERTISWWGIGDV